MELPLIKQALSGWPDCPDIAGPSFFFPEDVREQATREFQRFLAGPKKAKPPEYVVKALSRTRARILNLYALALNRPLCKPEALEQEARAFLEVVKCQADDMKGVFPRFGLGAADLKLLQSLMAHTAPTLYAMGFPDAAAHAAQVSKLCLYKVADHTGNRQDLLQAAMVGWMHDPKLSGDLSAVNLATHPLVASGLAATVFELPSFQADCRGYFRAINQPKRQISFQRGIVDALSINNDSRWVTDNMILPNLLPGIEAQIGPGMAGQARQSVLERLGNPGLGKKAKPVAAPLASALRTIGVETGLIGIRTNVLPETLSLKDLDSVLEGKITNSVRIQGLRQALKSADAFVPVKVSGLSLLSHHEEVIPSGRKAALALINSDPLLLSPHKVLQASKPDESLLSGITSFVNSFNHNIQDLPKVSQAEAKAWQRAVYVALLEAADKLAGQDMVKPFLEESRSMDIPDQLDRLRSLLINPATWQRVGAIQASDPRFQECVRRIESRYLRMTRLFRDANMRHDGSVSNLH